MADPVRGELARSPRRACPELVEGTVSNHIPKHGAHPSSPQPSASPLDARDFHRYGLARDDDAYILDTFPIIQRQDEPTFNRYRTKDLILAYVNALAAGDTDATVTL